MANTVNNATVALIKRFEDLRLNAYRCPAGKWTIGWGHTKDVKEGDKITETQAEIFLRQDILEAVKRVNQNIQVKLNDNQFGALVSFAFNTREKQFKESSLVRLLNNGWYEQVPAQLARWNKATVNGVLTELEGLTKRRRAEAALWNSKEGVQ